MARDSARAILSAGLTHSKLFDIWIDLVKASDFVDAKDEMLVRVIKECRTNGEPADIVMLTEKLRALSSGAQGPFAYELPADYLATLAGEAVVFTPEHLVFHATRVRSAAAGRRRATRMQDLARVVATDSDQEFRKRIADVLDEEEPAKAKSWPSPADRASVVGGHCERLATNFETFDKATRGGLRPKKVIVFGGAPGAGKTTWAAQLGWQWASKGVFVAILASDEDADGLLIRIGQAVGFNREDLENGNPFARERFSAQLSEHPNLLLVDADESEVNVEEISAELKRMAGGKPSVLIIDSIQTVNTVGAQDADGPRARVDSVIATLKRCAKVDGHLVIATCELARGSYRSKNASEQIDDLAAFKESGGIEYGVATALVLRSVATAEGEANGLVDVTMPKNRLGRKLDFRIQIDHARATFREIQKPTDDDASQGPSHIERIKERVLESVAKSIVPIASRNELARRVKGSKKPVLIAIEELLEESRLVVSDGKFYISKAEAGLRKNGHSNGKSEVPYE